MDYEFSFFIKQLCSFCYRDNKYHGFKDDKCVNCHNRNINTVYVNAKNDLEFVRDFRNSGLANLGSKVDMCNHPNVENKFKHATINRGCSYANSEYEYFVWNWMSTHKKYKISVLFLEYIKPFVFTLKLNLSSYSVQKHVSPRDHCTLINPVPHSHDENERVQQEEKKKLYWCWFCFKNITSDHEIGKHVSGNDHKLFYDNDKKCRWYFKMPNSQQVSICEKSECECLSPHFEDEEREMKARVKFKYYNFKSFNLVEKDINPWPLNMELSMPLFPHNLDCYRKPVRITVTLNLHGWNIKYICLRDDESRPFYCLYDNNNNQKGQMLTFDSYSKVQFENFNFDIEFFPLCSGTYTQRIEYGFVLRGQEYCCQKLIRNDVGTSMHLAEFSKIWTKYSPLLKRDLAYDNIVPFPSLSDDPIEDVLSEVLLRRVFRIISNLHWLDTRVESWNYCDWMRDMMVHEELEQQLLLSQLLFLGNIKLENTFTKDYFIHSKPGQLFGTVTFKNECHNTFARDFLQRNSINVFVLFNRPNNDNRVSLYECQIIDEFRYKVESRSMKELTICLSESAVKDLQLEPDTIHHNITIIFRYNRLVFDRRHKSLDKMPHYDGLSYVPLCCPSFTRIPFGEDQSAVYFKPKKLSLNPEQERLPRLVLRHLSCNEIVLPFILNGAFGTGKSSVIAETVGAIIDSAIKNYRVLICTRSYSAGEVYLKMFQNCLADNMLQKIKMIMPPSRKLGNKFSIYNEFLNREMFEDNKVFITSLDNVADAMKRIVDDFDHNNAMFDYLFVDEAAHVLEVDAIMVYQFGKKTSKFVFAGDVFQVRPDYNNMSLRKFSVPIICRLHNMYRQCPDYEICLKEVYRSHPELVRYLSEAIYRRCGLTSTMIPFYRNLPPMKFIDSNSNGENSEDYDEYFCSFKNELEAKMIVMAIQTLKVKLPDLDFSRHNILVCSPFYAQVKLIRDKLQKNHISVCVEIPSGFQGKEFDAVFISTVLTVNNEHKYPIHHPTFHSNKNLINLTVSRAKHYVEVIGDKNSLLMQQCSFQWKKFIEFCGS